MIRTIFAFVLGMSASLFGQTYHSVSPASPTQYDTVEIKFQSGLTGLSENGTTNPFLEYRMEVEFEFEETNTTYKRPGFYYGGEHWMVRFTPPETSEDKDGFRCNVDVTFKTGTNINVDSNVTGTAAGTQLDGYSFTIEIASAPTTGANMRKWGRVVNDGKALSYEGNSTKFLKRGLNSPETFLAYEGFDATVDPGITGTDPEKSWPLLHWDTNHASDWNTGDPVWDDDDTGTTQDDGKGIIGAINYIADQGVNSLYFLLMNIGGDGKNVWPFLHSGTAPNFTYNVWRYDISKLNQWHTVFNHAANKDVMLDLVLAEREPAHLAILGASNGRPTWSNQRKLYVKEMFARFGHLPNVRWILCEENGPDTITRNSACDLHETLEFTDDQLQWMAKFVDSKWTNGEIPSRVAVHTKRNDVQIPIDLKNVTTADDYPTSLSMQVLRNSSPHTTCAAGEYGEFVEDLHTTWGSIPVHMDELDNSSANVAFNTWSQAIIPGVYLSQAHLALYLGGNLSDQINDINLDNFRNTVVDDRLHAMNVFADIIEEYDVFGGTDADTLTTYPLTRTPTEPTHILFKNNDYYIIYYSDGARSDFGDLDMSNDSGTWKAYGYKYWTAKSSTGGGDMNTAVDHTGSDFTIPGSGSVDLDTEIGWTSGLSEWERVIIVLEKQ